jgi:hypothetical protein
MREKVVCGKHKQAPGDLAAIDDFKRYLQIVAEGQDEFQLSRAQASRYAAIEVYGDVNCEGSRNEVQQ